VVGDIGDADSDKQPILICTCTSLYRLFTCNCHLGLVIFAGADLYIKLSYNLDYASQFVNSHEDCYRDKNMRSQKNIQFPYRIMLRVT